MSTMMCTYGPPPSGDQLPCSRLCLAEDSVILTKKRGLKQLGNVPEEQAKNARILQLLRSIIMSKPPTPEPFEDDFSEAELEKVDSVVIIQLRPPVARAKSAPPAQSPWAPPTTATAAAPGEATTTHEDGASPADMGSDASSPHVEALKPIVEEAKPTSSSRVSAAVVSQLIRAAFATAIAATTATTSSSSSNSSKTPPKGRQLFKSASRKIKAAAASIARDFREGFHEVNYTVASSSAMLALWPVPLPTSAYTGLSGPRYNPYDPLGYAREYHY